MTDAQSPVPPAAAGSGKSFDAESQRWPGVLREGSLEREQGIAELHALLLRAARSELHRRGDRVRVTGPELDDLAHQAAADALLAILAKLGQFRGESRFTTWAYRFVILEVSTKLGRHFWRTPTIALQAEDWAQLPERFGYDAAQHSEARDLIGALRRAVEQELTPHQRAVFVAMILNGIPLDALVAQLGSTRGAVYKTMFDARGKLRAALAANGYLHNTDEQTPGQAGAKLA
jgi:RNA polymerase sigma-70 factor (ECF subfamily)